MIRKLLCWLGFHKWDIVHKNGKILKQCEVVNIKDNPIYAQDLKATEKHIKIHKIIYEVGDECVFEITKGDKKWTISLDDFFNKVIQICGEKIEGVDKDD